jgi:hypothetical protein
MKDISCYNRAEENGTEVGTDTGIGDQIMEYQDDMIVTTVKYITRVRADTGSPPTLGRMPTWQGYYH